MKPLSSLILAVVAIVGTTVPPRAAPASGIGTVVSAATEVTGAAKGEEAVLVAGSQVFADERIRTDPSGLGQIEFVDHTRLAIGPGSTLTLDRFIYDSNKGKTDIAIGFGQGTFRFITGTGSHQGYEIDTPVATIAVRGTAFDVAIDGDGEMAVAMIDGEVQVCSRRTLGCQVHNAIGQFLDLTPDGVFSLRNNWDATIMKGATFAQAMPFLVNDDLLQPTFRAGATALKQYAALAGQAVQSAGQAVGQAAGGVGQAAQKAVQAPAQAIQNVPQALKNLNPFRR